MSVQQRIAHEIAREKIGRELKLLVDQPHIARTEADAPDVDARVILSKAAPVGEFISAKSPAAADTICWPNSLEGARAVGAQIFCSRQHNE